MKLKRKHKMIILSALLIMASAVLILFPKKAASGAYRGIINSLEIIVPSLFPFMVFSVFLTESGLFERIFSLPAALLSKITGLNKQFCSLFLVGIIGGYHSAAKSISLLCKKGAISPQSASTLLCFCTNAGPAFLISAVGAGMFLSTSVGVILYISSVLSSFSLMAFYTPKIKAQSETYKLKKHDNLSVCFVRSVKESCTTMSVMCAFIILFSVFITLLPNFHASLFGLRNIIFGFLEVTSGCSAASGEISLVAILSSAAICGWGGLCVIFQIYAICGEAKIGLRSFIISRMSHSFLSALYTFLLLLAIPISTKQTFISNAVSAAPSFLSAPLPALMLLLCCVTFPIYVTKQKKL